jgi:integrase/recombinase XerD
MLSDRTLQGYARALRGFFAWLEAEEYLAVSPMRKLKLPRVEERLKDVLAVPDIERLLAVCNTKTFLGSRMYAMVALMYDSGLRAGEVVNLDLGDIDWGEYRVKIRRGKGKKDRFEPFSVATHRALRRYLVLRERFALDGQTALFISAAGDTITRGALTQAVKRLGKRAGIPHVHPHLFRHFAAIAALENGTSQSEVSRFLGHSQVGTTDIYLKHITKKMGERHRQFSPMARVNAQRAQATERSRKRKR